MTKMRWPTKKLVGISVKFRVWETIKVKSEIKSKVGENQLRHNAGCTCCSHNNTVPVSMWCGGGMHSPECTLLYST